MELWSIRLSFRPSVCLGVSLELNHEFFLSFSMLLETHRKLPVTGLDFLAKTFLSEELERSTKTRIL